MGTKRRIAIWFRRGRHFVVKAPGWENRVDLVFTTQDQMVEWAHNNKMILRDGNRRD